MFRAHERPVFTESKDRYSQGLMETSLGGRGECFLLRIRVDPQKDNAWGSTVREGGVVCSATYQDVATHSDIGLAPR